MYVQDRSLHRQIHIGKVNWRWLGICKIIKLRSRKKIPGWLGLEQKKKKKENKYTCKDHTSRPIIPKPTGKGVYIRAWLREIEKKKRRRKED
jgi:hypothetical protein